MKKIIIFVLVITLFTLWYFFAPIKWTFGLRPPRNFNECSKIGGQFREGITHEGIGDYSFYCNYKGKEFNNGEFVNF